MPTKKFLTKIKARLLEEEKTRSSRLGRRLDIDTDGDETDEIQGNIEIEVHHRLVSLNNLELQKIKHALDRIEKKTYGICVDCEESISEKRLLAYPYHITCISCAEERESKSRKA